MKIQIGKVYLTRDGRYAEITNRFPSTEDPYVEFGGLMRATDGKTSNGGWSADGRWSEGESEQDLIDEVPTKVALEPAPSIGILRPAPYFPSRRDYFAAAALTGLLSDKGHLFSLMGGDPREEDFRDMPRRVAELAKLYADAVATAIDKEGA